MANCKCEHPAEIHLSNGRCQGKINGKQCRCKCFEEEVDYDALWDKMVSDVMNLKLMKPISERIM